MNNKKDIEELTFFFFFLEVGLFYVRFPKIRLKE